MRPITPITPDDVSNLLNSLAVTPPFFAKFAKLSDSAIYRWMNESATPSERMIQRIEAAYFALHSFETLVPMLDEARKTAAATKTIIVPEKAAAEVKKITADVKKPPEQRVPANAALKLKGASIFATLFH